MKRDTGGRSSATPRMDIATAQPRESSALHSDAHHPRRKKPGHFPTVETGSRSIIIFLTVCTKGRRPVLANNEAAKLIVEAWCLADFWCVGRYVIMPEHIHLFCAPNTFPPQSLKGWISFWRNHVTRSWPNREQVPIWQREYWDRQLRRGESYAEKWAYVENNPVRHGYASRAEEWPYQGELNVLDWHD